jgi:hypothetical protein
MLRKFLLEVEGIILRKFLLEVSYENFRVTLISESYHLVIQSIIELVIKGSRPDQFEFFKLSK